MSYIIGYILIGIVFSTIVHLYDSDKDNDHYLMVFMSGIIWWFWIIVGVSAALFIGIPWIIGKAFKR